VTNITTISTTMSTSIIAIDRRSQQNAKNLQEFYDLMFTHRNADEAIKKYLVRGFIQHNPTLPTSARALGKAFAQLAAVYPKLRIELHRIIAAGNYVWTHVRYVNIYSNEVNDRGIAAVNIYRFNKGGKIVEYWDVLQPIPDPESAANTNGML
jgi:predicted SnoaL-like aldol condensation-catalyzing enzyme